MSTLKELFEASSAVNFYTAARSDSFIGNLSDDQETLALSAMGVFEKAEAGRWEELDDDFLTFDVRVNLRDADDYEVKAAITLGGPTVVIEYESGRRAVVKASWGSDYIELKDDGSGLTEHLQELAELAIDAREGA